MRKKTSNDDLSKRAKKLVKKWQTVVNNHIKKTKKTENLNGVVKPAGSLNGSKVGESLPCTTEAGSVKATGVKRRRVSPEDLKQTTAKTVISPRLVSSPKPGSSPRVLLNGPPRPGVSPRLVSGISSIKDGPALLSSSPKQGFSPKIRSKLNSAKSKLSGLVGEVVSGEDNRRTLNSSLATEELTSELNCSDFLNTTIHKNNKQSSEHNEQHIVNPLGKCSNEGSNNNAIGTDATATNSTDSRVQEDRIVLSDYISPSTTNGTNYSFTKLETETETLDDGDPTTSPTNTTSSDPVIPKDFPPIESEDLEVVRKDLPDELISTLAVADGVNGVYNERTEWCPWVANVEQRSSELLLLPYVILD